MVSIISTYSNVRGYLMRDKFMKKLGIDDLPALFPEVAPYVGQEKILASLFHVIANQVRLRMLDKDSIERVGKTHYVQEDNTYQVILNGRIVDISMQYTLLNRLSFGGLNDKERSQIPDRGMFPPPALRAIKEFVIAGDDEESVMLVYAYLKGFVAVRSREVGSHGVTWLERVRWFACERLCDQSYPWLALEPEVADFYEIRNPHK